VDEYEYAVCMRKAGRVGIYQAITGMRPPADGEQPRRAAGMALLDLYSISG